MRVHVEISEGVDTGWWSYLIGKNGYLVAWKDGFPTKDACSVAVDQRLARGI